MIFLCLISPVVDTHGVVVSISSPMLWTHTEWWSLSHLTCCRAHVVIFLCLISPVVDTHGVVVSILSHLQWTHVVIFLCIISPVLDTHGVVVSISSPMLWTHTEWWSLSHLTCCRAHVRNLPASEKNIFHQLAQQNLGYLPTSTRVFCMYLVMTVTTSGVSRISHSLQLVYYITL